MLHKNTHRMLAAGSVAASLLIAAPAAQADEPIQTYGCHIQNGCGGYSYTPQQPWAPVIGIATSGVPGGTITATATWSPYKSQAGITGYRVRATRVDLFAPGSLMMSSDTLNATTSAMQPGSARSLSMTLPSIGTYTFEVQAINEVGGSSYSAASNRVTGQ